MVAHFFALPVASGNRQKPWPFAMKFAESAGDM